VKFHIVTIFPEFFRGPFEHGVVHKAREAGKLDILIHDLRDWTSDRHRTVDDRPFGGGEGMLLKPQPIFEAVESIWPERASREAAAAVTQESSDAAINIVCEKPGREKKVVLLSAQGRKYDQSVAREFSRCEELLLICGRYEGVDERVAEHLADEEISIGDYVLSGGELAAAVVVDSVARLLEGVLGNEDSTVHESFSQPDLLDCPQYTRPAEFRGWKVPDVLLGGNHAEIGKWRHSAALEKTRRLRPDLADKVNQAAE
jgi:tRNA (guanine37-N1)-methyltransferase